MKKTINLSKFNAILNTDAASAHNNAELTLQLRIGFRQINPPAGATHGTYNDYGSATGTPRKIIKWNSGEWFAWKNSFVQSAQRFWHGKFWLSNNAGYFAFLVGKQIYLPNIWCRFELIGNDALAGPHHHVIDVVRLDPSENWFGSHSTLYDSLDTRSVPKGIDSNGKPIMQRAHVHEIGHLLGMGHVDEGKAHCPVTGNTNANACYGISDIDKNSVMGSGMQLRPEHAKPWMTAIDEFVKVEPPSTIYPVTTGPHPFTASLRRTYPHKVS